jgi:glutathione S-transferase
MKLYDAARAPSPRRVRLFMAEKGLQNLEVVQVDLSKKEQHSDWFKGINPLGTVPVLSLDNDIHIAESSAICRYLEELQPEPNLLGGDSDEKAMITMWLARVEQYLWLPIHESFRHSHAFFKEQTQITAWAPYAKQQAEKFMLFLDNHLSQHDYMSCDRFSAVDINVLCVIEFARVIDLRIDKLVNFLAWHERVKARPSYLA